jgi:hypothetical protein
MSDSPQTYSSLKALLKDVYDKQKPKKKKKKGDKEEMVVPERITGTY